MVMDKHKEHAGQQATRVMRFEGVKFRFERKADIQTADFSFFVTFKKACNAQSPPECRSSGIQGPEDIESKASVEMLLSGASGYIPINPAIPWPSLCGSIFTLMTATSVLQHLLRGPAEMSRCKR